MEIQYDSNGDGWEIGAPYEFSRDKEEWKLGILGRVIANAPYPYAGSCVDGFNGFKHIRICQTPVVAGKIHKKPVELIPGKWYWFKSRTQTSMVGVGVGVGDGYTDVKELRVGANYYAVSDCSDIKRMVEAEDE